MLDATGQRQDMNVLPRFVLFLSPPFVPTAVAPREQPRSFEECSGTVFRCPVTRECIPYSWTCVGAHHCADGADEATCPLVDFFDTSVGFFDSVVGTYVAVVFFVLYTGFKCWLCYRCARCFFTSPADILYDDEDATSLVGGPMADESEF